MKTAFYSVALGAALLLTGSWARPRTGYSSGGPRLHGRPQVPVRGRRARRGTHSGVHTGAHQRTFRGLLIKAVEGCVGLLGVPCGHAALLPRREIWRHRRLHETASRRGQRPVQGSDGVHRIPRRRLATSMRKSVLIGATVIGAALLATLRISVKWSAENTCRLRRRERRLVSCASKERSDLRENTLVESSGASPLDRRRRNEREARKTGGETRSRVARVERRFTSSAPHASHQLRRAALSPPGRRIISGSPT